MGTIKKQKVTFSLLIAAVLISNICFGQTIPKITALFEKDIKANKAPALAVAVIDKGKIVHLSAHGLRDIKLGKKTTVHTPFHIASVSKTVTNMAVFTLVEAGKIDLNADVSNYLPFKVKNPHFPNEKITTELLLKHRSGIKDDHKFYGPHWDNPKGDPTLKLADYLKDYLVPDGKFYKKTNYDSRPNHKQKFKYSNSGVALLGLIVQHVSGMNYEDFCQKNIFRPMGMKNTSWFLKNLDSAMVAKTYIKRKKTRMFYFKGHNGYPDYPGGLLRTSITDYAKLINGYLNADNGQFILSNKTKNLITPPVRSSHQGFYTWFVKAVNNHLYYSHGGGDMGVRTISIIEPNKKRAIVIFANHPYRFDHLYRSIEKMLWTK